MEKADQRTKFLQELSKGFKRAANYDAAQKKWIVDETVKLGILEIFKTSAVVNVPNNWPFRDKDVLISSANNSNWELQRIVPGGTSIRPGVYLGENVIIMPPSFVNIGAYVGSGTMIDSHVLVGSCAQIGSNVHLSAKVMIGGVLEPANSRPVIVEDEAFIGANCSLAEGVLVKKNAILGMGVQLGSSIPVYDLVNDRQISFEEGIPENAVVISGTRSLANKSNYASVKGLSSLCALIIKYSAEKNAKIRLEEALREFGEGHE